jgi:hypothetical protein
MASKVKTLSFPKEKRRYAKGLTHYRNIMNFARDICP